MQNNTIQVGQQTNPALMGDPNYNLQMLNSQRQQALAQALTQQGLAPIDYDHAGKISPLQGLNKMLAAYLGGDMANKANEGQANLMAQGQQMQLQQLGQGTQPGMNPAAASALTQGAAVGDVGPTVTNAQRMGAALAGSPQQPQYRGAGAVSPTPANPYGLPPTLLLRAQAGDGAATEAVKTLYAAMAPTDQIKNDTWAGTTPQQRNAIATTFEARPNQTRGGFDANGKPFTSFIAADPDSGMQYSVGQNGQITANGIPNVPQISAQMASAKKFGENTQTLTPSEQLKVNADGTLQPSSVANTLHQNPFWASSLFGGSQNSAPAPATTQGPVVPAQAAPPQSTQPKTAVVPPNTQQAQPQGVGQPIAMKVATSAKEQQVDSMTKGFGVINDAAQNAPAVIGKLNNIDQLANSALTGKLSDKLAYANGLLSAIGVKQANDIGTATDLLNKNSNQITAMLGSGKTDLGNTIIQAAFPNAKMQPDAIHEAVRNLKADQQVALARAKMVQPYYNSNDAVGYQNALSNFNQHADGRVWQFMNLPQGSPQRAAYAKANQDILPHIQALEQQGAFK